MTSLLNDVLGTDDLPLAELHALKLLGEVYPLAEGFCPVDLPALRAIRARAVAMVAPSRFIADRRTAAWVWTGIGDAPAPAQFCLDIRLRKRGPGNGWLELREVVIRAEEVAMLGTLPVTSPLRTAVDIARDPTCSDSLAVPALVGLFTSTPLTSSSCITHLNEQASQAYCRRARGRIMSASAVVDAIDVVDRVDATDGVEHAIQMGRVTHLEHEPAHRQSVA